MTGEDIFKLLNGNKPLSPYDWKLLPNGDLELVPLPTNGKDLMADQSKQYISGWFDKEGLYAQQAVDNQDVLVKDKKDDKLVFRLEAAEILACKTPDDLEQLLNTKYYAARPY